VAVRIADKKARANETRVANFMFYVAAVQGRRLLYCVCNGSGCSRATSLRAESFSSGPFSVVHTATLNFRLLSKNVLPPLIGGAQGRGVNGTADHEEAAVVPARLVELGFAHLLQRSHIGGVDLIKIHVALAGIVLVDRESPALKPRRRRLIQERRL
jgi:hypothetical protein